MRISDWSSDVCSSDLMRGRNLLNPLDPDGVVDVAELVDGVGGGGEGEGEGFHGCDHSKPLPFRGEVGVGSIGLAQGRWTPPAATRQPRSEEHTSELQSLMRNSYAVFCLKKKT